MAIGATPLGTPGSSSGSSATNPNMILAESGLLNALYGEKAAAVTASGESQALGIEAGGATAEAGQYGIAGAISGENAQIAQLSGQLQEYQNTRTLMNTLGKQAADVSGAGFADSGSAVYLARSSLQQGLLQNQVLGLNANMEAGGYLEQAAASQAEQTAATTTASAETTQAGTAAQVSAIDTAQAAATGNFLSQIPGVSVGSGPLGPTVNPAGGSAGGLAHTVI